MVEVRQNKLKASAIASLGLSLIILSPYACNVFVILLS